MAHLQHEVLFNMYISSDEKSQLYFQIIVPYLVWEGDFLRICFLHEKVACAKNL